MKGGSLESAEGLRAFDTSASVGPALGYWVKEGVGLVVHFPLEDIAKINTPMRSMRSMRGGFIFRNRGPSLKVHHCQHLASVTKHDTGGSPPGAACDSAKPPHGKT